MNITRETTYGELKEGDRIWLQGHEFKVTDLTKTEEDGKTSIRFKGVCTSHASNDNIRNTMYNGGSYGAWSGITCAVTAINECAYGKAQELDRVLRNYCPHYTAAACERCDMECPVDVCRNALKKAVTA